MIGINVHMRQTENILFTVVRRCFFFKKKTKYHNRLADSQQYTENKFGGFSLILLKL